MSAAEDWTPTANSTRMVFMTTPLGATSASEQMLIDYNGFVGIGTGIQRPDDRLHVRGDIRVRTGGANGCLKSSNDGTIIGVCASDARFKRRGEGLPRRPLPRRRVAAGAVLLAERGVS